MLSFVRKIEQQSLTKAIMLADIKSSQIGQFRILIEHKMKSIFRQIYKLSLEMM